MDGLHDAVYVVARLDVHDHDVRARIQIPADGVIGVVDHEMHVERNGRDTLQRLDDRRPYGEVRNEMTVHHVNVDDVGACCLDKCDGLAKSVEVCRQNRWRDEQRTFHQTSSSTINPMP
jgi:hypothetical protein